ncbi:hypothetical protein HU200_022115 [Digitaria exilis]|uniref:Growth-regulating factor n=1 Tax=Digitaria exilis TaxID=1010633 RepID=A0A835C8J3_9POAL|nr:hypothetical protein HU200_022115 [Digitaria exilis]
MRIRKRTPASAAEPVPAPPLPASPPRPLPLLLQPQPKQGRSREEEEEAAAEEKRVILVAGVRIQEEDHDRVPAVASLGSSAMDDVPKPEPQGAVARCSRNDGKRWRCKSAAAPGYLFCDRHIAWSSRQRKPRPKKHRKQQQQHGSGSVLGPTAAELEEDTAHEPGHGGGDDDEGVFGGGGFQKKRAKGAGPGPAA